MLGTGEPYKAPTTAGTYRVPFSDDTAIRGPELPAEPGEDAGEDVRAAYRKTCEPLVVEYLNTWRVARETGDWSKLVVADKKPTFFVLQWIPREAWRRWSDLRRINGGDMGLDEGSVALVRLALLRIDDLHWPGFRMPVPEWDERLRAYAMPRALIDDLRRMKGLDVDLLVDFLAGQIYQMETTGRPL